MALLLEVIKNWLWKFADKKCFCEKIRFFPVESLPVWFEFFLDFSLFFCLFSRFKFPPCYVLLLLLSRRLISALSLPFPFLFFSLSFLFSSFVPSSAGLNFGFPLFWIIPFDYPGFFLFFLFCLLFSSFFFLLSLLFKRDYFFLLLSHTSFSSWWRWEGRERERERVSFCVCVCWCVRLCVLVCVPLL